MAKLYLIPTTLGDSPIEKVLPAYICEILTSTKYFIVENIRTARRFLKKVNREIIIDDLIFFELNKHSNQEQYQSYLQPIEQGHSVGIISEAGCPGVADPGSEIVIIAHQLGYNIEPLVGPSSILLSLMASGLNGQNFSFLGYLPVSSGERHKTLKNIERESANKNQTQIFIETPYRNNQLLNDIIAVCNPGTLLCIASEITLETENIRTFPVIEWKNKLPNLHKKVAIFLLKSQ